MGVWSVRQARSLGRLMLFFFFYYNGCELTLLPIEMTYIGSSRYVLTRRRIV